MRFATADIPTPARSAGFQHGALMPGSRNPPCWKPALRPFALALLLLSTLLYQPSTCFAQNTIFTYQGYLTEYGAPANGVHDLRFQVWSIPSGGALGSLPVTVEDVGVVNGLFTVLIDFGSSQFPGAQRWLEVAARPGASTGAFTVLTPRQALTPTPYAITALGVADGSINAAALANGAVTGAKLAANSITAASVGTNIIIGTSNIANGAVTSNKLANASVGGDQLVKPYEARAVSDYNFFFRLERTQETNVVFTAPFVLSPVLTLGMETRDSGFAETAAPRTLNRTSNGFALQFTLTNVIDTQIAYSETNSTFTGLSGGLVSGRPAVVFANLGCVVTFVVTNVVCEVGSNVHCCFNAPGSGYICLPVSFGFCLPGSTYETNYYTNCQSQGYYQTNCSGGVNYARAVDATGNGFETLAIATGGAPRQPSFAVVNNRPAVSFYDTTSSRLRFVLASNSTGTAWRTPQTPVNHADVGQFSSLTEVLNAPAISYFNDTSNNLEYIRGPLLSGVPQWISHVVVDNTSGRHSSLMVLNDRPVIACFQRTLAFGNGNVAFYRSTDDTGSSWGSPITVAPAGDLASGVGTTNESVISLALVSGRPAIAFYNEANNVMQYVRALNTNGTSWGTPVSLPLTTFASSGGPQIFTPKGGPCQLSVQGGRPTIQFAAGADVYVVTADDSLGTTWNQPVKLIDASSTGAQVGGLLTLVDNRVAAFHAIREVTTFDPGFGSPYNVTNMSLRYLTRNPPPFAINWIAVQP